LSSSGIAIVDREEKNKNNMRIGAYNMIEGNAIVVCRELEQLLIR